MNITILLAFIITGILIYKLYQNNKKKEMEQKYKEEYKKEFEKKKKEDQLRLPIIIKNANEALDDYARRIELLQDKYQIGRALSEFEINFDKETSPCVYNDTITEHLQGISDIKKRISILCNSDISIERGYKDFLAEKLHRAKIEQESYTRTIAIKCQKCSEYKNGLCNKILFGEINNCYGPYTQKNNNK